MLIAENFFRIKVHRKIKPLKIFNARVNVESIIEYRQHISLDKSPSRNTIWLKGNFHFRGKSILSESEFGQDILHFYYYDEKGIYKKGTYTPHGTLRVSMFEAIDGVGSVDMYGKNVEGLR